jgi:hypothetical protein
MTELAFVLFETAAAWDERGALARFRRALRRADQLVLDDLLELAGELVKQNILDRDDPCIEPALLALLLGEQKRLTGIREGLRAVKALQVGDG